MRDSDIRQTAMRKCPNCGRRHEPFERKTEILGEWRGIPIVKAYPDEDRGVWIFWCDYCQDEHVHEYGAKGNYHLKAHCSDEGSLFHQRGYFLSRVNPLDLRIEREKEEENKKRKGAAAATTRS